MSIYHSHTKIIGRSKGRSAVASSAYRSGECLLDKETGITHDYTHKGGVVHSEIMLCENAPEEYADRETLWNAVHEVEKSSNAQLAREIEIALPYEWSREKQIKLVREYVRENFVEEGMIADWSLHDTGKGNPHAHIMLTTRAIKQDGKWAAKEKKDYIRDADGNKIPEIDPETGEQKVRVRTRNGRETRELVWKRGYVEYNDWNNQKNVDKWRKAWEDTINQNLDPYQDPVSCLSYRDRGIDQIPTVHEGYAAREMEKRGEISERMELNRSIRERNRLFERTKEALMRLQEEIYDRYRQLVKSIREHRRFRIFTAGELDAVRISGESTERLAGARIDHQDAEIAYREAERTDREIAKHLEGRTLEREVVRPVLQGTGEEYRAGATVSEQEPIEPRRAAQKPVEPPKVAQKPMEPPKVAQKPVEPPEAAQKPVETEPEVPDVVQSAFERYERERAENMIYIPEPEVPEPVRSATEKVERENAPKQKSRGHSR